MCGNGQVWERPKFKFGSISGKNKLLFCGGNFDGNMYHLLPRNCFILINLIQITIVQNNGSDPCIWVVYRSSIGKAVDTLMPFPNLIPNISLFWILMACTRASEKTVYSTGLRLQ